jgi:O-antigen/teichoic acid export membrane protein
VTILPNLVSRRTASLRSLRSPLARAGIAMMAVTVLTAISGFGYWTLAAHRFSQHQVGQAASLLSALTVIALVSSRTLTVSLLGRLPRADDRLGLLRLAVFTVGALSFSGALGGVAILPWISGDLSIVRTPTVACFFVLACLSQAVAGVLDGASVATRRSKVMLARNAIHGFGKLGVLLAVTLCFPAVNAVAALIGSWALLGVVSCVFSARRLVQTLRRTSTEPVSRRESGIAKTLFRGSVPQTIASLAGAVPPQLLPLLVAARLGATAAATFAITWQLGGACFTVSPSVCTALLAEGAYDPAGLARRTRSAAKLIAAILLIPMLVFLVAGRLVLHIFGSSYAAAGAGLLAVLAVSAIPDAVTNVATAWWRVRERMWEAATVNAIIAVVAIAGAWVAMGRVGLIGGGVAWIGAQLLGCAYVTLRARPARRKPDLAVFQRVALSAEPVASGTSV